MQMEEWYIQKEKERNKRWADKERQKRQTEKRIDEQMDG